MVNFAQNSGTVTVKGVVTSDCELSLSIPKEKLALLPTVDFFGKITVIETQEAAHAALDYLNRQKIVGFDTETRPSFRKGRTYKVSLIQLSTLRHSFLFRINKLGLTDELREFLENENIIKVGLSIKDDFHVLHRISKFEPGGFIDLQPFVKRYGIVDNSLQRIYGIIFGERISKSQRLSNWEAAELSEGQCVYASIDAWACLKIYNHLTNGFFDPKNSPYVKTTDEETDINLKHIEEL